ncbi:MAG: DEAD/DEAH box helicase [Bacteroidetes bacterium]|nr:DEAD/DEAH box helicase [Bacteroidota bacterium]
MSQEIVEQSSERKLYPYQQAAVNTITQKLAEMPTSSNLLFQLPTGGGKTIIFSEITKHYIQKYQKKVLILTHRVELSQQTSAILNSIQIPNKVINSSVKVLDKNEPYLAYTALIETLNNRLHDEDNLEFLENVGLVIVDEAHNNSFRKVFKHFSNVHILGVTATPLSSNKKLPLMDTYHSLIIGENIPSLIENGFLCDGLTYSHDVNLSSLKVGYTGEFTTASLELLYSNVMMQSKLISAYEEISLGKKTLIFNSGIISSRLVYEAFKKKGYPVKHLDSTYSDKERYEILDWFHNTKDAILTSVSILTHGFDEPEVETIILNRATKSLTLYHQMIGRGSRITPTKKQFNIVDLGNNVRRFGLWQMPIDWNHVFIAPHMYLEQRYKDEWDYETERDYDMPEEIKQRFVNSHHEEFVVRDKYLHCLKKGLKPQVVLDQSLEEHYGMIKDNASCHDEAVELLQLLQDEIKYRVKQFAKCINATPNYTDWQYQNYLTRINRKMVILFEE